MDDNRFSIQYKQNHAYFPYDLKPHSVMNQQASILADKIMIKIRNGYPQNKKKIESIDEQFTLGIPSTKVSENLIVHDEIIQSQFINQGRSQRSQSSNNSIKQTDKSPYLKNTFSDIVQSEQNSLQKKNTQLIFSKDITPIKQQQYGLQNTLTENFQSEKQKLTIFKQINDNLLWYLKDTCIAEKYLKQNQESDLKKTDILKKNTYKKQDQQKINQNPTNKVNKINTPHPKKNVEYKQISKRIVQQNTLTPINDFHSNMITPQKQIVYQPKMETDSLMVNKTLKKFTSQLKEEQQYGDQNYAKDLLAQLLLVKKVKDQFLKELRGQQ